jgi:signal transduction histidine kinase
MTGEDDPGRAAPAYAAPPPRPVPSIRTRLANALVLWSVAWALAVGAAAWLAASHEVDELLDDGLRSSAELLAQLLAPDASGAEPAPVVPLGNHHTPDRFAWQVVAADGRLLQRSARAPDAPWRPTPTAGLGETPHWRLYGLALGDDGRMLYTAQAREERTEARVDVALGAMLSALAVGLLGHAWLRARVRAELKPLQVLSDQLGALDIGALDIGAPGRPTTAAAAQLGPAQRRELQPVHQAIDDLTRRLALRIANEQAFSGQAAHALRTPLAGIDAQLAVVLRDCPPELRDRLQRVRGAATRLQAVVGALLGLFRSGADLQCRWVPLAPLLARLPPPTLQVHCPADAQVWADPDLLAAALLNLLDNAQRHRRAHRLGQPARCRRQPAAGARRWPGHAGGPTPPAECRAGPPGL